jgi:choline dehydrogenase-like flavoprotein
VILDAASLKGDAEIRCEAAVIGTGAGGAIAARALARAGVGVVLLEEGGHHTSKEFDMEEAHAYPMLYQEQGNRATADLSILVLQGRAVGGGTVVNWTTSFRTPARVLEHWARTYGLEQWSEAALRPYWEEVERYLNIQEVAKDDLNPNNGKLWEGLGALGWSRELIRRNVRGCMKSGYCGMGCPIDAKLSMLITAIPEALERGAQLYTHCRAWTLEEDRGRITAIHCLALDDRGQHPTGNKIVIRPKICVLSGGALNSPALLLRSKIGNQSGRVGQRTFLHPTLAMVARHVEPIEGYYGAPQSVSSHHFADRGAAMGYFFETAPIHPMLAALALNGYGKEHRERMEALPKTSAVIALLIDGFEPDEPCGTVHLKSDGHPRLDYPFSPRMEEAARAAQADMARILLASGALEVRSLHSQPVTLRSLADLGALKAAPFGPNQLAVFSAHQMGGCAAGADPNTSVVRSDLRHHHLENLFVLDGSVFPTSLGVNPQLSIFGIASLGASHVLHALGRG